MDIKKKKHKLLGYGVQASKSSLHHKNIQANYYRLNDQEAQKYIEELFATVMEKEVTRFEMKGRIGKVGTRSRPIRIEIDDHVYRRSLLRKASSLKDNKNFENIFLVPDLTRKQQEEDKMLRDKLKEYRNGGVDGVKINRGCIVRMDGNNRVVLFGTDPSVQ